MLEMETSFGDLRVTDREPNQLHDIPPRPSAPLPQEFEQEDCPREAQEVAECQENSNSSLDTQQSVHAKRPSSAVRRLTPISKNTAVSPDGMNKNFQELPATSGLEAVPKRHVPTASHGNSSTRPAAATSTSPAPQANDLSKKQQLLPISPLPRDGTSRPLRPTRPLSAKQLQHYHHGKSPARNNDFSTSLPQTTEESCTEKVTRPQRPALLTPLKQRPSSATAKRASAHEIEPQSLQSISTPPTRPRQAKALNEVHAPKAAAPLSSGILDNRSKAELQPPKLVMSQGRIDDQLQPIPSRLPPLRS